MITEKPHAGMCSIKYRKIPIVSPRFTFVQKAYFAGLIFGVAYFRRGLLLEGILRFKIGCT